jgi:hypothetical protein
MQRPAAANDRASCSRTAGVRSGAESSTIEISNVPCPELFARGLLVNRPSSLFLPLSLSLPLSPSYSPFVLLIPFFFILTQKDSGLFAPCTVPGPVIRDLTAGHRALWLSFAGSAI